MLKEKQIVYLGYSSFPHGLAEAQKIILISKSLLLTGNHVSVICRNGVHNKKSHPEMKAQGNYQNIEFIYASGSCFRDKNFFKRRVLEIKGKVNEALYLRKRKKNNKLDFAILSTRSFYTVLYYSILSKLLNFKTILNYVEYYSSIKKRRLQIAQRVNDKLFDKYGTKLVNTFFPISEFIINHITQVSPQKKYLKIPVLTDFEKYNGIEKLQGPEYFLFCGDASYKEIILFIIDSFLLLKNKAPFYLYLVINGYEENILEIKKYINEHVHNDTVKMFSKLTEKQLYTYYKNATALLIPLRPTIQDIARFPHKTGEYLASGNPVISTNYGEIKYYFKDRESMLVAESYDINLFAEKMQFVIDNPAEAKKIGIEGKNVAKGKFDYRAVSAPISEFLNSEI